MIFIHLCTVAYYILILDVNSYSSPEKGKSIIKSIPDQNCHDATVTYPVVLNKTTANITKNFIDM